VTQRLIKVCSQASPSLFGRRTHRIAANCTQKEDAARKVEREMSKRLAAVAMQNRIGATSMHRDRSPGMNFWRAAAARGRIGPTCRDKLKVQTNPTDVQHGFIISPA